MLHNILSPVLVFDPSTDTISWALGFCVYGFLCVLLFVWGCFFLTSSKSSLADLFLSSEEAGLEKDCVA